MWFCAPSSSGPGPARLAQCSVPSDRSLGDGTETKRAEEPLGPDVGAALSPFSWQRGWVRLAVLPPLPCPTEPLSRQRRRDQPRGTHCPENSRISARHAPGSGSAASRLGQGKSDSLESPGPPQAGPAPLPQAEEEQGGPRASLNNQTRQRQQPHKYLPPLQLALAKSCYVAAAGP